MLATLEKTWQWSEGMGPMQGYCTVGIVTRTRDSRSLRGKTAGSQDREQGALCFLGAVGGLSSDDPSVGEGTDMWLHWAPALGCNAGDLGSAQRPWTVALDRRQLWLSGGTSHLPTPSPGPIGSDGGAGQTDSKWIPSICIKRRCVTSCKSPSKFNTVQSPRGGL